MLMSPPPHQIMDDGQDGFPRKQEDERIAKLSTFPYSAAHRSRYLRHMAILQSTALKVIV